MTFSPGGKLSICLALVATLGAGAAFAQAPASPSPPVPAEPSVPLPPVEQPGLLAAGGALDARTPDVVVTLRAGVQVSPAYFGSDDYEVGPDLAARIDYFRFPNGFEYGSSRTVGFRTGWGVQGSFRYLGERDSDDHDQIEGLDNVPWAAEAGLGVGYEQRNWRVFTDVRYGFVGHNAWVGEVGADGIAYPVEGLTLTLGPRLEFGDDRFASTYFGISAQESVDSGLPQFQADGGVLGAGLELGARYLFNERWGVEGAAGWQRLMNDAADSPVTETGSEDQYSVRVGITRRISLDF
jgi:outer membrane scaffolding protein for murein synthesis (MipA/OmpV family)